MLPNNPTPEQDRKGGAGYPDCLGCGKPKPYGDLCCIKCWKRLPPELKRPLSTYHWVRVENRRRTIMVLLKSWGGPS